MIELIVLAFLAFVVVAGFVAVALRFMPRDAQGVRRLPRMIDESVGMHFVRRTVRRRGKPVAGDGQPDVVATGAQVIDSSGAPVAPAHTVPSRFVVSRGTQQAHPMSSGGPVPLPVPSLIVPAYAARRRRARSRPVSALAFRGRVVGVGGIAVLAIVVLAVVLAPREPGGVLAATGTPGFSASAGGAGSPSPEPTLAATATLDPSPASPTPDGSPTVVSPTVTPGATPSPTARPTPTRAPRSTSKPPTPAPTIAPTPTVAPTPSPSASPAPIPSPSPSAPTPTDSPSLAPSPSSPPASP